jgi:queuine tRNA-ribosyltransferase
MNPVFSIVHRDPSTAARTGQLLLAHGSVDTPAFMPVGTAATVKAITHERLENMGYTLILGNTYHLYLRPGAETVRAMGGIHGFSSWPHNILTDSGGFQVFSLADLRTVHERGVRFRSHLDGSTHEFTPEGVVDTQVALGSDIQMQLDVCTGPEADRREALDALTRTTSWAGRAKDRWLEQIDQGYHGALFGIVQGNFIPELRKRSAEEIASLELPGIAIGGLSVGEEASVFQDILSITAPLLPDEVPHYLMGVGTPDYIFAAVGLGIDMFDCVLPTRIARNGTVMTPDGRVVLKNEIHERSDEPIQSDCGCATCTRYSRGYLRHLFKSGEMLGPMLATEHNLYYYAELMHGIRDAIDRSEFSSFAAQTMSRFDDGERERRSGRD